MVENAVRKINILNLISFLPTILSGTKESDPRFQFAVFANRTLPIAASILLPGSPTMLYI